MANISTNLGDKIRARRRALGLTLDELAKKIESTKSYVWELENKPKSRPSAEKIFKLASALGVEASYFLEQNSANREGEFVEVALFRRFKALDPRDRKIVETLIDQFEKQRTDNAGGVGESADPNLAGGGASPRSQSDKN